MSDIQGQVVASQSDLGQKFSIHLEKAFACDPYVDISYLRDKLQLCEMNLVLMARRDSERVDGSDEFILLNFTAVACADQEICGKCYDQEVEGGPC